MTFQTIVLLSLIQGITEFLPISSSAHLLLFPVLLHITDQGIITDVFAHLGSLLAVMIFYKNDIKDMFLSLFDKKHNRKILYALIIATLPIVFVGLLFLVLGIELRNPKIVIYTSIIFGSLFYIADKFGKKKFSLNKLSLKNAFYIGMVQVLASIPGVSRSGITTTCGLFLGYKREDILKFSFLLSIPTIALVCGGGILKFALNPQPISFIPLIGVSIFSFIFSLISMKFMMSWIKYSSFKPFAIYRVILGIFLYLYLK